MGLLVDGRLVVGVRDGRGLLDGIIVGLRRGLFEGRFLF